MKVYAGGCGAGTLEHTQRQRLCTSFTVLSARHLAAEHPIEGRCPLGTAQKTLQ